MDEVQVQLVKRSWKVLRKVDPALVADVFYSKLFNDTPGLRKMFPKNMAEQYQKLIDMVNVLVAGLDRLDQMEPEIVALGRRHVSYGVRAVHYKLAGKALLWTLEQGLGSDWTPDIKKAWALCYNKIASIMMEATTIE